MTEVISIRFRGGSKNYDFDPVGNRVAVGDEVVVETAQGPEFAVCTEANHLVDDAAVVRPLAPMLRPATDADRRTAEYNRKREKEAFGICEKKIAEHGLEMKLVSVSCSFDGSKIIFFFTADGRVDFRELVRDLAGVFRARIELRQIGVRDEAKMLGGLGICGRPFCCSQFLDGFLPVSIKMAKTQNLSLNPTKISGTCGRLMCCLKYEQNAYEDAARRMPKADSFVQTPDGPGNVRSVDLLQEKVRVSLDSAPTDQPKCFHNCEICVLRNGKGTRDGIDVPVQRPDRFVPEKPVEDDFLTPLVSSFFRDEPVSDSVSAEAPDDAPEAASAAESGDKPRRRHRGGRGRRPGGKGPEAANAAQKETDAAPRRPEGEQKAARPPRAPEADKPRPETPPREGGDKTRRRPHHRGGRRHRGGPDGSSAPSAGE